MSLDIIALTAVKAATSTTVKSIIDKIITPLAAEGFRKILDKKEAKKFSETLSKYLTDLEDKCANIKTIAFQNYPKKLVDLYEPLTISDRNEKTKIKIDRNSNIFKNEKKILIIDRAGMGKTTLSKRVILNEIERQTFIPIFIELRQLKDHDIKKHLKTVLGIKPETSDSFFSTIPFLYVFDGVDEIQNSIKNNIIKKISEFMNEQDANFLITSRHESDLSLFSNMAIFNINSLENEQAYSLLKRYDEKSEIYETLIKEIKKNESKIDEFLSTPLYVSLLFCAYRHKTKIPNKVYLFYSQVYEALFDAHDLSKESSFAREKYSKLGSEEFHRVLRRFGFNCLANNGKLEYQTDELRIEVKKAIDETIGIVANCNDFIKDMIETVPLFIKEGGTVRWSHKSLMEYFSAMFICFDAKANHKDIILYFYNCNQWERFINILELCADIDFPVFRESVIKQALEDFLKHKNTTYKKITNRRIKKDDILTRQILTYIADFYIQFSPDNHHHIDVDGIEKKFKDSDLSLSAIYVWRPNDKDFLLYVLDKRASVPFRIMHQRQIIKKTESSTAELAGIAVDSLKIRKTYDDLLNDDPESVLNNSTNFSLINSLLQHITSNWIPFNLAENELRSINKDQTNNTKDLLAKFKT